MSVAQTADLDSRKREVAALRSKVKNNESRRTELLAEVEQTSQSLQAAETALETARSRYSEEARQAGKQQKAVDRYLSKRQRLSEQRDKCNRSIRSLGVLPEEAFEDDKYSSMRSDKVRLTSSKSLFPHQLLTCGLLQLLKQLHKANESLKKFSHVNKKAVEQWNNFTKQRDQLRERKAELETSAESIQELVDVLDQRKDEAIERTFKQVSKNFEDIFAKLVPAGRGQLVMQRRIDQVSLRP